MIGPLSGDEGIAVKNYAKTQPQVTFINGSSAAQETTLRDPAPNFYRFNTDGAQWMVGLGELRLMTKGYKKIVLIAEDYSFPYSQVQGFMVELLQGRRPRRRQVLGAARHQGLLLGHRQDPRRHRRGLVVLGGADAVNFLTQYEQAGGNKPMIGGSITVDQTVLNYKGKRRDYLLGTPSAGPMADNSDSPKWKKFVAAYKKAYPNGFPSARRSSPMATTSKPRRCSQALDAVKGDLSDGQKTFREALASETVDTPTGHGQARREPQRHRRHLPHRSGAGRRTAISTTRSSRSSRTVDQTLGLPEAEFKKMGPVSRDDPELQVAPELRPDDGRSSADCSGPAALTPSCSRA